MNGTDLFWGAVKEAATAYKEVLRGLRAIPEHKLTDSQLNTRRVLDMVERSHPSALGRTSDVRTPAAGGGLDRIPDSGYRPDYDTLRSTLPDYGRRIRLKNLTHENDMRNAVRSGEVALAPNEHLDQYGGGVTMAGGNVGRSAVLMNMQDKAAPAYSRLVTPQRDPGHRPIVIMPYDRQQTSGVAAGTLAHERGEVTEMARSTLRNVPSGNARVAAKAGFPTRSGHAGMLPLVAEREATRGMPHAHSFFDKIRNSEGNRATGQSTSDFLRQIGYTMDYTPESKALHPKSRRRALLEKFFQNYGRLDEQ